MTSPLYSRVLIVTSKYVDTDKATEILERQMKKCGSTSATFGPENLVQIRRTLIGAVQLYLSDAEKRYKLADEIQAMV